MAQRRATQRPTNSRSRTQYRKAPPGRKPASRAPQSRKRSGGGNFGWLLLALVIIAGGIIGAMYVKNLNTENIAQGVYIDDINVSDMSKENALATVDQAVPLP